MIEPKLKKKSFFNYFKGQNFYSLLVILLTIVGISYGIVFFTDIKEVSTGTLTTGTVGVDVSDDGSVDLVSTTPLSDTQGLNKVGEAITIENTSNTDLDIVVSINPSSSNTLSVSNIRYGVYINNYQYKEPSTLDATYVVYEGILLKGETIELDVNLWINESYGGTATVFTGTFNVDISSADMLGADYIERSANKNNGLKAFLSVINGTNIRENRYSGIDAKNYVWFNCKDGTTSGSGNCELWRIVGMFDVKGNEYQTSYRRIKIVRDENITTSTFGGTSFSSSSINTYLNGTYYNNLNNSAKKMIISAPWNIGTTALTSTSSASYASEIASVYYAKVGLLSPSDVGFTTTSNYVLNNTSLLTSSWLTGKSFYTLNSDGSNIINSNGSILTTISNTTSYGVKPSVYLSPTVSIIAGNGTSDKPFELSYLETEEFYGEIPIVGYVTYDTTGYDIETPEKETLYINSSVTVTNEITSTTLGGFQGWSTTSGGEVVYQPGDTISESDLVNGRLTLYPVVKDTLYSKVETSLASYLLADDGDARILSGGGGYNDGSPVDDENFKNYVWYSGKLWRIVALNNDGSIKLVTDENVTTIAWGADTTYEGSWMYQWLNEDFLDTLYNYENLLVTDYKWNATETTADTKPAETTMVEGTVGLLNYYEHSQSCESDSATCYLNDGYDWWLITPEDSSNVRYVNEGGWASYAPVDSTPYGVRPSVNLKSDIVISCTECDGSKTNPYQLVGDISIPTTNELLNNRVSGEYVTFDNGLYRIVSIENNITKITKVDYLRDSSDTVVEKYLASTYLYGASSNTQTDDYWDYYLNNTWYNSISSTYKNMLVSGTWYLGSVSSSNSYKNAICATSNTTETTKSCAKTSTVYNGYVGLGRIGEMFTSQLGEGYSTSSYLGTITPYSSSAEVWFIDTYGYGNYYYTDGNWYVVRPSVNLKSNIKITGGLGTLDSPFEIAQ